MAGASKPKSKSNRSCVWLLGAGGAEPLVGYDGVATTCRRRNQPHGTDESANARTESRTRMGGAVVPECDRSKTEGSCGTGVDMAHLRESYFDRMNDSMRLLGRCPRGARSRVIPMRNQTEK